MGSLVVKMLNCSSKYNIYFTGIFAEKKWVAFANHIFAAKILAYVPYLMIKDLTKRELTTSLVLNKLFKTNEVVSSRFQNYLDILTPL